MPDRSPPRPAEGGWTGGRLQQRQSAAGTRWVQRALGERCLCTPPGSVGRGLGGTRSSHKAQPPPSPPPACLLLGWESTRDMAQPCQQQQEEEKPQTQSFSRRRTQALTLPRRKEELQQPLSLSPARGSKWGLEQSTKSSNRARPPSQAAAHGARIFSTNQKALILRATPQPLQSNAGELLPHPQGTVRSTARLCPGCKEQERVPCSHRSPEQTQSPSASHPASRASFPPPAPRRLLAAHRRPALQGPSCWAVSCWPRPHSAAEVLPFGVPTAAPLPALPG